MHQSVSFVVYLYRSFSFWGEGGRDRVVFEVGGFPSRLVLCGIFIHVDGAAELDI